MDEWSANPCFTNNHEVLMPAVNQRSFISNYLFYTYKNLSTSYNISNECLEAAGQMYIYMFLCPKFMFDWTTFYLDMMQNASTDTIIQTLNRINITGNMNSETPIVDIARKILNRIQQEFSLQFQSIDSWMANKDVNLNSNWTKGILGKRCLQTFIVLIL